MPVGSLGQGLVEAPLVGSPWGPVATRESRLLSWQLASVMGAGVLCLPLG